MPVSTAIVWLKTASAILMIGFGLMFAIAAYPPTSGVADLFVDLLFWPLDGAQSLAAPETRIILANGAPHPDPQPAHMVCHRQHLLVARRRAGQHSGQRRFPADVHLAAVADGTDGSKRC